MDSPLAEGSALDAMVSTEAAGPSRDEVYARVVELERELDAALAQLKQIEEGAPGGLE